MTQAQPPSMTDHSVRYYQKALIGEYLAPIAPLFDNPTITNIFVDRFDTIYYRDADGDHVFDGRFESEEQLHGLVYQVANNMGLAFGADAPICHATLPDGSRFTATSPPINGKNTGLTIRLFPKARFTLAQLSEAGSFPSSLIGDLSAWIQDAKNILVVGSTDSGKTTLLNALLKYLPDNEERIVTVEDTAELVVAAKRHISLVAPDTFLQSRHQNQDINLGTLIETTLRLSPDRIIVGEIRHPRAASAFFDALNTGHTGVCTTIHANSAESAVHRLALLVARQYPISAADARTDLLSFLDLGIYCRKGRDGVRRIGEIVRYSPDGVERLYAGSASQ